MLYQRIYFKNIALKRTTPECRSVHAGFLALADRSAVLARSVSVSFRVLLLDGRLLWWWQLPSEFRKEGTSQRLLNRLLLSATMGYTSSYLQINLLSKMN
jgi:hypothetical protein